MASSQTIARMSPRQKMINLMYIVLTAMLALNVSSDVLNGFNQVEGGLARTNKNMSERNDAIYNQLAAFNTKNPEKGGTWFDKATELRIKTAKIYQFIDTLKTAIIINADGNDADIKNIKNQDNLEAASVIMLAPNTGLGHELKTRIDNYRSYVSTIMTNPIKKANIQSALSTNPHTVKNSIGNKSWEEGLFENMPVVAAVTLLTKIQNDLRYAEGEALNTLLNNIDAGDVRVNEVNAFVIPASRNVMRGSKYSANIVLAAVDTTARPTVYINGTKLNNDRGIYEVVAGKTGVFDYSGYLEVPRGDGTMSRHDFKSSYTVIEPMATVSATMMNVLYAGINNPISIAVPGIPPTSISASMTNGTLTRNGDIWIAKPSKVGAEAVVSVTATIDGHSQTVATTNFRVRKLPDPTPYIPFADGKGNQDRYKGSKPFAKTLLLQAAGIEAAIDDDLLNVSYRVLSFETVFFDSMGNAIPEVSQGSQFSQRQKDSFRRLSRGKRFIISRVRAIGPDGIERTISPMEVIVN
ncbi:MAG: gliding motility protein GldM [Muribaculaceae bacterium]|nr:gliding motility protein GldM [Muribaculaceae bacterium]